MAVAGNLAALSFAHGFRRPSVQHPIKKSAWALETFSTKQRANPHSMTTARGRKMTLPHDNLTINEDFPGTVVNKPSPCGFAGLRFSTLPLQLPVPRPRTDTVMLSALATTGIRSSVHTTRSYLSWRRRKISRLIRCFSAVNAVCHTEWQSTAGRQVVVYVAQASGATCSSPPTDAISRFEGGNVGIWNCSTWNCFRLLVFRRLLSASFGLLIRKW